MNAFLRTGHYIAGEWYESASTYPVLNPATGEVIAQVAKGGAAETTQAIAAAERALPAWRRLTAKERGARVKRWGELMLENRDALAELLTLEQGKPLAEARGEVGYAASFFEWFAEEAKRSYGDVIPSPNPNAKIIVTREPVGVVAAITPWNFPLAMITRKAGPALAAGCTMVLKPSEETPLSAFALAVLAEQAGIPPGVFNIVSGDAVAIGGALTESDVVRKLSFTGSTRVGKLLAKQSADTLKKLSLELGGNAPFIVFDDADLDAAVQGAMASKFRNTGQTCVCVNRFYVQDGIYDAFTSALTQAVRKMRVGNALQGEVEQGPLINQAALRKVEAHVADALQKGAKVLTGAKPHALGGTFYEPTVLANASNSMLIAEEETFGPVAACFRFKSEDEAIAAANDTPFGLSAYFYTRDLARAWRVAEALESGMVGINEGILSTEVAPFGGVKQSGLGREGSKYGLDEYTELKYMMMGGLGR
ncbi:NAD-dependent succinate-semialdehyde dehydrogenase [Paraburkholderia domus]|jgi:succinate-semialdehyde dehydrogenase|uniref:Glutarate-semialdehyde dehydrogenase n=1 Tax=Paraburkholderia domus TaxID=2793075 RepID=A0A9N8QZ14_9BURK|nr:NAD-dependent succinate-semialdehyde dehydrogenase [Paraburkholderia domus]MBK5050869.1 NAD-dependent succinate-semialdehyde dehydrogenase [Burkholderia sp. R-70006]MBK5121264.1 NAD-dependent succinate-semialdehyde dehydrogenase [Burkholderia sp. R-69980]MBK5166203.1 NAD-dependent succinate-semialdehyde dehydrogenase [Burkholderia sp. R-70211]CAE6764430.1 Glutarate-semialdehyde dehydrogenase [Paraburkholderia domus]CAE6906863.1 Glutarate-semialdehyde dehydrogenase [Paraburkholderia domus]